MPQPLRFKFEKPTCSNCSAQERLHLVTCAGPGADEPGRALLYCPACRIQHQHMLDVSVPIELVWRETLVGLYGSRKTASDPRLFLELILGVEDTELAEQLVDAMEQRGVA